MFKFRTAKLVAGSISKTFSTSTTGTNICIIGGGPAGFYAAQQLAKLLPTATVDIYERLPVPFGLVRYGVAPDHPEVKNVINTFTKTASHPRVNFYGNVSLGQDVTLNELREAYQAVLLTYGAEEDRRLNVPGEDAPHVLSARRLVGWYNGLPSDTDLVVPLNTERALVVGQGNVAVDVARILLSPVDKLRHTDITEHALDALSHSRLREVGLVGRRGPLQVAFTIKELRELLHLPGVDVVLDKADFENIEKVLPDLARPRKRLTELLLKATTSPVKGGGNKTLRLVFNHAPLSVGAEGVEWGLTRVEEGRAVLTERTETLPAGLVLRSIGYKSVQAVPDLPFDSKNGVAVNKDGKIAEGLYCSGWLATGPVGVILSTMSSAFATAQSMAAELEGGRGDTKPGSEAVLSKLRDRGLQIVKFSDWEKIDKEEERRGKEKDKPREKILDVKEMLRIAS